MQRVARPYQLKKRAERQEETRQRIVEAAVALHGEIGPARTTVKAIAERAGVERHTYYRHFPEERELFYACSGHFNEQNPLPDPSTWRSVADPEERLHRGLGELYDYYEKHESLLSNVTRDMAVHPLVQEVNAARTGPTMQAMKDVLVEGLVAGRNRRKVMAAVAVATDFATWRTLVRTNGLRKGEAAKLMAKTTVCAA
jgi:AcrR family transcriptional regulator